MLRWDMLGIQDREPGGARHLYLGGQDAFQPSNRDLAMGTIDSTRQRRFSAEKMQKLNLFETDQMFCDVYCLRPGQAQHVHTHAGATKFYYVIEGEGRFTVGERRERLGPGAVAWSEPDEPHGVANESEDDLVLLVAMAPNPNR